jgi:hypothetical protein
VRPEPDKFMKQSGKSWEAPTHRIGFTDRDAPQAPIGLAITGGASRPRLPGFCGWARAPAHSGIDNVATPGSNSRFSETALTKGQTFYEVPGLRKAIEEPAQAAGYAVASLTTGPNPP